MELKSIAYRPGGPIPVRYSCEGENVSPPFFWVGAPEGTKSLALILHDPDAREGAFTHWVVYDIDPDLQEIDEDTPKRETVTGLGTQGRNDRGSIGYTGPCPTSGIHHYIARIHALDVKLNLPPGASSHDIDSAMQNHILGQAALMGTFAKATERVA
jgi:hypothetical protein